jgi:ABC-type amino acid transport system permease subunit
MAVGLLAGCGDGEGSSGSGYAWGWDILNPFQAKGLSNLQFLVGGLGATVVVPLCAIFLSVILGALVAVAGLSKFRPLQRASRFYVELFLSIPLLVLRLERRMATAH